MQNIALAVAVLLSTWSAVALAADPTCADLVGTWHNQLGSTFRVDAVDSATGALKGQYKTASGASGWYPLTGWVNTSAADPKKPNHVEQVVSWAVRWEQIGSITSWTGYCTMDPNTGAQTITGLWHLARPNSDFSWDHVVTNTDIFSPGPPPAGNK